MNSLINSWVDQNVVEKNKKELVEYGLHQGVFMSINVVTIILISYLFHQSINGILFLVFFSSLRSYAGGYHSSSILRCYFISTLIVIVVNFSFHVGIWTRTLAGIVNIFSVIILVKIAPVDSENRRLETSEIILFRMKTRKILLIESILSLLAIIIGITHIYETIAASMLLSTGLAYAGKIKNIKIQ